MDKKVIVRQNSYKDCGSSCLLSIMKYYGVEASHEEVSYILKTNNSGTNAYNIINGSRTFGFDGYGIHYSYDEIVSGSINYPIICHVNKNNRYHFIVVYGINKNKIIIMDPSSNINELSKEEFKKIYLNTSIVIFKVKNNITLNKEKNLIEFIFDYIKIHKDKTIKMIVLSLITIVIGIIINYYLMICVDYILPKYNYYTFCFVTIIFLILYLFKDIILYIRNNYLIYIENSIYSKLNIDIIKKLFNLPYQYFKSKQTGEIESRLNDLKVFKGFFSNIIVTISMDAVFILFSSIILLIINYKVFLINIFLMILYSFIILIYRKSLLIKNERYLISEGQYMKHLNESINGYESNKNINYLKNIIKLLEIKFCKLINDLRIYERSINEQSLFKNIIVDISYIISIFISIIYVNKNIMSIGELILFNSILYYFVDPLKNILDLSYNFVYLKNVYNRINDLILIKTNYIEEKHTNIIGDISINNLSYSIDGLNNIFDNISINIKYGSKFLMYGNSGNGKSTLMKILMKYIDEYKGSIYINNVNLKDISSYNILYNFTYVSQNSYINNDTLKNNIIYNRNISDKDYEDIINLCNLNRLRDSKKLRNDFIIEDNGFNISGGERQKIILARSLLKNSNYLILDEVLSEVDILEEKEIIDKILNKYKNKTIIYISHKEQIIDLFNNKYKLERSRDEIR